MLARSRATQHVEECLDVLNVHPIQMEDAAFRRAQAERITDAIIAIYLGALRDAMPTRKIVTGLHRRDRVIGTIGI